MMKAIRLDISVGQAVTLHQVYQNHLWLSPHPGDSIEARWGLRKCETIFEQTRTTRDAIAFIERTYRKKDPAYADFTIWTQKKLLGRLQEEWSRSECKEGLLALKKKVRLASPPGGSTNARQRSERCKQIFAEIRATQDAIAFIEKTYRKKDPAYADFTIRTQQQLLEGLNQESKASGCSEPSGLPEKKASK